MLNPFNHVGLIFALFLGIPFLLMIAGAALGGKKKIRFLNNYVRARGYQFENPEMALIPDMSVTQMWKTVNFAAMKQATDGLSNIKEFSRPSVDKMGFVLTFEGKRMTVFAHAYSFHNGYVNDSGAASANTSNVINLRVAKLPCDSLPIFRLEKHGVVTTVESMVEKLLKAGGAPTSHPSVDLSRYPKFASLYRLTAENEPQALSFLTDSKIAALERSPLEGTCATSPGDLVYFEQGRFSDEKSYDDFIARAKSAFASLLM
jgi:hypothetical protein